MKNLGNDKFMIFDATDDICIGGFGNDEGNIALLKYTNEEIKKMMLENNSKEDDIRFALSLLGTIRNLVKKEKLGENNE